RIDRIPVAAPAQRSEGGEVLANLRARNGTTEQCRKTVRGNRRLARLLSLRECPMIGVEPRDRDADERGEGRRRAIAAPDRGIDHGFAVAGSRESASSAAASVCSTCFVVWAVERNPASNWDGAR